MSGKKGGGAWVVGAGAVVVSICAGVAGLVWAQEKASGRAAGAEPAQVERKAEPQRGQETKLKENTRLVDREGRILCLKCDLNIGTIHRSVFEPKDGLGYFVLLENNYLEKVEDETRHGEREVKVSGTVMEYRGENFLLLTRVYVKRE